MVVAHLPKGTVRAIEAVDGPLAYLSVHRADRRDCRWVGLPSNAEAQRADWTARASLGRDTDAAAARYLMTLGRWPTAGDSLGPLALRA
jgi:hypothetical protein